MAEKEHEQRIPVQVLMLINVIVSVVFQGVEKG